MASIVSTPVSALGEFAQEKSELQHVRLSLRFRLSDGFSLAALKEMIAEVNGEWMKAADAPADLKKQLRDRNALLSLRKEFDLFANPSKTFVLCVNDDEMLLTSFLVDGKGIEIVKARMGAVDAVELTEEVVIARVYLPKTGDSPLELKKLCNAHGAEIIAYHCEHAEIYYKMFEVFGDAQKAEDVFAAVDDIMKMENADF